MSRDFLIGCTYNFLQPSEVVSPLEWFRMVKDTGAFDYMNWLPPAHLLSECAKAAEVTGIPMVTGNCQHVLDAGNEKLFTAIRNAAAIELKMLNVMLHTFGSDGRELTVEDVVDLYIRACALADRLGVEVSFELHVDCWSEKYKKVLPVIEKVGERGRRFNFTLDYSHVLFKIDNPEELAKSDVKDEVDSGAIILDPYEPGNILEHWLSRNVISFAQFRPVAPNQPRNVWARNPDGSVPRGIMYPFLKPKPGEWHSRWSAYQLAACKKAFRTLLEYHLRNEASPLRFVITEMIARADYGLNAKFSLLEHNAACAQWIRQSWQRLKARREVGSRLSSDGRSDGHLH